MPKKRVYEAAKDFDLSSEALIKVLRELDYDIKSPMSVVTEEMIGAVKKKLEKDKAAFKRSDQKKRRKLEEKRKQEARVRTKVKEKRGRRDRRRRPRPRRTDQKVIEEKVKETLIKMEYGERVKRRRPKEKVEEVSEESKLIKVSEFVSVSELAATLGVEPNDIIAKCLGMGLLVTINQRLDFETIVTVADEFGYEVELLAEYGAEVFEEEEEGTEPLPPVVTVMGHVDHGKTSLLDYIRQANVMEGESGGITQHIGAYELELDGSKITFLDTPGHQAFTAMRARGAQLTDICVLVVAADDGVMPQTVEAIDHARAAGVPIIVAINKVDLPNANPEKVKQELLKQKVRLEEFGGKVMAANVSAKTGEGVEGLLESIVLEAEMLELKTMTKGLARGAIIESKVDRGKGAVATVLVRRGTLEVGDPFVAGLAWGKVRAMYDEHGKSVDAARPSSPVQVVGLDALPEVGDSFVVVDDEKRAREISRRRKLARRDQEQRKTAAMSLESFHEKVKTGETRELKVVLKGDVAGSVEALTDSLEGLSTDEVRLVAIHRGVGAINESDVLLALASQAIVIGFHVSPDSRARETAKREEVEIREYNVIYEAIDEVRAAMTGLLEPAYEEETVGTLEVREIFRIARVGTVAGCFVTSGRVGRGEKVKVTREGEEVHRGEVTSLRRLKDDVRAVEKGYECGVMIEGFEEYEKGDVLEAYQLKKVERSLT